MRHVDATFYSDWTAERRQELSQFGYDVSSRPDDDVVHIYLNLQKRLVEPTPRQVHRSKEFQCPTELQHGLSSVESAIIQGDDLSPYLSKFIKRPDYDDPLLNHWGIHHLHLGTSLQSDQFVERTGPLLFARFDSERAYLIDVFRHGAWAMQDMIRILHENWPKSIEAFRLNGVVGLANPVSDDDVKVLRRKNVNTFVEIAPNIVYAPIGGGAATSGISVEVVRQANYIKDHFESMERAIIDSIDQIADKAKEKGVELPAKSRFELKEQDGRSYAVEIHSKIGIPL